MSAYIRRDAKTLILDFSCSQVELESTVGSKPLLVSTGRIHIIIASKLNPVLLCCSFSWLKNT